MSASASDGLSGDAESKAVLMLAMRAKGIRDLGVLRAMEGVPRAAFVPHRYLDLATRDIALPLGCGQTMDEPLFVARVLEALAVPHGGRVLEIGCGSGYVTALLARLAAEVLAVERFQRLAAEARARLAGLGIANAAVIWADGLAEPPAGQAFDRILVGAALPGPPAALLQRLTPDGSLIYPRHVSESGPAQHLIRVDPEGQEEALFPSRLQAAQVGRSASL